ncbi:MAG: hypothetical protein D3923_16205 [Candidatus Electrothrix sp. AR3]|nr:hypothetical protein [Candidatus Electrothrix sp. AR3]
MALSAQNMAKLLIKLYKSNNEKKKGKYRLSKDEFKSIAGKASLREAYFWDVDASLREDGFLLIDLMNEVNYIGILSVSIITNKFQELPGKLVEENLYPSDNPDEDW